MASIIDRVKGYLHSPSGRRNVEKAKRMASDPQNQQKARGLLSRFTSGRSRTHR